MLPTSAALAVQFVAFVVTARGLGAEQFGLYTGILAVSLIGGDLTGLGAIELLMKETARERGRFARYFGHLLRMTAMTLPILAMAGAAIAAWVMHLQVAFVVLVAAIAAELLNSRAIAFLEGVMVSHGDPVRAAWVRFIGAVLRLLAAMLYFAALGRADIEGWVAVIAVFSVVTAIGCYVVCVHLYGAPGRWFARNELSAAMALCLTQVALTFQANVDRVVLSRFSSPVALGSYGAAMRVLQLGQFPVQVATRITYPKFFEQRNVGLTHGLRFARKVSTVMLPLGLVAYGIVVLAAWAVPIVLGADFREAGPLLMVVGLALPAMALQTPPADVLTAAQKHKTRAGCYWAFALGFVPLAVAAASTSGAIGVAWAFVGVNVVLAVMLWIVVVINARGES